MGRAIIFLLSAMIMGSICYPTFTATKQYAEKDSPSVNSEECP